MKSDPHTTPADVHGDAVVTEGATNLILHSSGSQLTHGISTAHEIGMPVQVVPQIFDEVEEIKVYYTVEQSGTAWGKAP